MLIFCETFRFRTFNNGWNRRVVQIGPLVMIFGKRTRSRIPLRVEWWRKCR